MVRRRRWNNIVVTLRTSNITLETYHPLAYNRFNDNDPPLYRKLVLAPVNNECQMSRF